MKKEENVMSNNLKKFVAVALLSFIGLAGCSKDVQAKPGDYQDSLITFKTDSKDEIYHNLVSIIEDAYREGSLPSAVLDRVLYTYSVSVFGRYNRVAKPTNLGEKEITLKEAAKYVKDGNNAKADEFIESHKAYWSTNDDGERLTTEEAKTSERARVLAKWNTIEDRISRNLYSTINGGSYSQRGFFSERKYLQELRSQLHKVEDPKELEPDEIIDYDDEIVITPDVQEEQVFFDDDDKVTYLHRAYFQTSYLDEVDKELDPKDKPNTYIEDEIIPTIYRSLLVEQYLLDESYNTLGRSYARKVNVISISTNNNNDKAADYLMKYFVRDVINGGKLPEQQVEESPYYVDIEDFKAVSNAYKGVTAEAQAYLEDVNTAYPGAFPKVSFEGFDGENYDYYVGTDYGDMMMDFEKIKRDINLTDTGVENDFTGSGMYTADIGKTIKENDIKKKDYTTDGWYIKNGGLADLPDSIKSRLFNIGVANILDSEVADRFDEVDDQGRPVTPAGENKLVAKINGKFYLKVANKQTGALDEDDILFYEGGKYYVIQIEEAVSGSKLAKETTNAKYDTDKKEEIINEVCRIVASSDTYQTASTKHWLEQAAIKYHDTKVYDYFKSNYPELFD